MSKPLCVVSCPIDTFSGYGGRSRDFVKSLIESKSNEWEIKILSQRWGLTPFNFIEENKEEWGFLLPYLTNNLYKQPEIWIQITIPSEFQQVGKYNIGITAGIETTVCSAPWIEGINRMDLVLVPSKHSKDVFINTQYEKRDNRNNTLIEVIKVVKPIEILFEGCNNLIYKPIEKNEFNEKDLFEDIKSIPEKFAFLFVGHWLHGEFGEDRKNVSLLLKAFYETFKNRPNPPALILKTSLAGSSYMDRREIQKRIDTIRKTVNSKNIPNVYVLHGEFSDLEMNELYNHPKVKAMISLTKGEGFGRPLLEFSFVNKPIIASGWSGHLDFLNPEFTGLIPGELKPIHPSAQSKDMLIENSQWFSPNLGNVGLLLKDVLDNYDNWKVKAKRQGYYSKTNFSYEKMKEKLDEILVKYIPEFPKAVELKLPTLKKINLPSLQKIN
jgi:glycosyltransferase involved in cell wall biosynthesis